MSGRSIQGEPSHTASDATCDSNSAKPFILHIFPKWIRAGRALNEEACSYSTVGMPRGHGVWREEGRVRNRLGQIHGKEMHAGIHAPPQGLVMPETRGEEESEWVMLITF